MDVESRSFSLRIFFILLAAFFVCEPAVVHAGFGITPPYITNHRLTRGSTFEQKITLVRSDPVDDLKVQITMNIPGIETWFTIDRGTEFILPKGTTQMPIVIKVNVPEDATYAQHKGSLRIRTASANVDPSVGGVSIALGAQVDVDVEVVDKIFDFDVRRIRISDLEEGKMKWGLLFPGKIRFFMTIENTGNETFGPTKVKFDIYDNELETLLETTENTNSVEQIAPFGIKEVMAELPTQLPAGRYAVKYTIYKNDDIAQQNQLNLSIATLGAVAGYAGYGFEGLSIADKLKIVCVLGVPVLIVGFSVVALSVRRRRTRRSRSR